ncbi:hypothetical protein RF11_01271 [Thelohanellus kitauei]|uniref:Uncharacterized protein n=1 Tax=Thelohanellus kitauei TaxID=669202 RepID=A0A0C2NA80_THEKT|nr:hypothetical protein RF11_01271 [Thelohanellus kitauei]
MVASDASLDDTGAMNSATTSTLHLSAPLRILSKQRIVIPLFSYIQLLVQNNTKCGLFQDLLNVIISRFVAAFCCQPTDVVFHRKYLLSRAVGRFCRYGSHNIGVVQGSRSTPMAKSLASKSLFGFHIFCLRIVDRITTVSQEPGRLLTPAERSVSNHCLPHSSMLRCLKFTVQQVEYLSNHERMISGNRSSHDNLGIQKNILFRWVPSEINLSRLIDIPYYTISPVTCTRYPSKAERYVLFKLAGSKATMLISRCAFITPNFTRQ